MSETLPLGAVESRMQARRGSKFQNTGRADKIGLFLLADPVRAKEVKLTKLALNYRVQAPCPVVDSL